MSTEALWAIGNLLVCLLSLAWLTHLIRSAQRKDSALLGIAGHYRLYYYLAMLALVILVHLLAVERRPVPASASWLLMALLAGQLVALAVVDRWHRAEERHRRGRVEMYSDLNGCLLLLGVTGLAALSLVPAVWVLAQVFWGGE